MDGEDHDDIQWSYKAVVGTKSFQKELEWDEYENLIYLIKLLTFFGQEMHGDQEYEKKRFTERICRLLIPYISWEWKDTYTVLCKEICEVSFHRMTLKFI